MGRPEREAYSPSEVAFAQLVAAQVAVAGTARRRPRMLREMTYSLVICACSIMTLGVRLLVLGARQEARWRQGGGERAHGAPPSLW
jgi:hypothetical protein